MVALDGSESCRDAEVYYHDYMQDPRDPSVPPSVAVHIEHCLHCRRRIETLQQALRELEDRPERALSEKNSQLIAELQLHFEHIDDPLACADVKPFLCRLLSQLVRFRIPTPVTVHVDQCAQCADDLDSLRQLALGVDQLAHLSWLLREGQRPDPGACPAAQLHSAAVAAACFDSVSPEVLDHLCTCSHCRRDVYQHRQRLLDGAARPEAQMESICCEQISTAELFDCVVPYGRRPESFRAVGWQTLCDHIRSCPRCLERMQQVHRTVFGIVERSDSGVLTTYSIDRLGPAICGNARPISYGAYPIDVQVDQCDAAAVSSQRRIVARLMHRFGGPAIRPLARAAFLVAAMIPLAVVFFVSMPSASGLSVRQVDHALARAETVRVSVFREGDSEPFQRLWVSRSKGIVISEMVSESRIYDLPSRRATVIRPGIGIVEHVKLDRSDHETVERSTRRIMESSLMDIPLDTQLNHRAPPSTGEHAELDVYELTWQCSTDPRTPLPGKLTVYVDPITRLPRRQEVASWVPALNDWHVQTSLYEYPDDGEIEAHCLKLLSGK